MFEHYVELITDPAHTLVEFTFVLLDVLIIDAVRRRWRKHLKREHLAIDAEHGVVHGEDPERTREYAALSRITGFSREELDELGGLP